MEPQPDHPIIRLQRVKETSGLVDIHKGLQGRLLKQALQLLDKSAAERADYTPYLAAEIIALVKETLYRKADVKAVYRRVSDAIRIA